MDNCRAPLHVIGRRNLVCGFDNLLPDVGWSECFFHNLDRYSGYALNGRRDFDIRRQTGKIRLNWQGSGTGFGGGACF
jgi:hypothetical protein